MQPVVHDVVIEKTDLKGCSVLSYRFFVIRSMQSF